MKVHHVGYLVKKLERAERDFMRLGYERETDTVYDPIRQVDISFWKNGDYRIELVSPKTEESVVYELMKTCKNMPYHICYETEDLEEERSRLRNQGFFPVDEPTPAVAIDGRRVCFMMSGQSGMIELLEVGREKA